VVLVPAVVLVVDLALPPVDTLGDDPDEHAAASAARAKTPAASAARERETRRGRERDWFDVVLVTFIMTLPTDR
jgi:hypothetical protein